MLRSALMNNRRALLSMLRTEVNPSRGYHHAWLPTGPPRVRMPLWKKLFICGVFMSSCQLPYYYLITYIDYYRGEIEDKTIDPDYKEYVLEQARLREEARAKANQ